MKMQLEQANQELIDRVTAYLRTSGQFDPEFRLLMECREHLYRLPLKGNTDTDGLLRLWAIVHLQEAGKLSASFAARLIGVDPMSYRLKREDVEADMQALIADESIALQTRILEDARNYKPTHDAAKG